MSESHHIVGGVSAEPLPAGRVGARLRVPLSGMPSRRWSQALSAHLTSDLTGQRAVGHLLIDDIVQGSDLVLEGVEDPGHRRSAPRSSRPSRPPTAPARAPTTAPRRRTCRRSTRTRSPSTSGSTARPEGGLASTMGRTGLEPVTSCLSSRRSPS